MTMTRPALNPDPERKLLAWDVANQGEPASRQQTVVIWVWVPVSLTQWEHDHCWDLGRFRMTRLADYIEEHLGFTVCRTVGFGHHYEDDGLTCASIIVRARLVRQALAARAATLSP